MEDELDYKRLYEEEKKKTGVLKTKVDSFSLPSKAKLFYALNRHENDWADMLNSVRITDIDISTAADKTVDRLKIIYGLIGAIAPIIDNIRTSAGITGNENEDMKNRKPFVDRIADERN